MTIQCDLASRPTARSTMVGPTSPSSVLSDAEFELFQRLIHDGAGIWLAPAKKALVAGRLIRRVHHHGLSTFRAYHELLGRDPAERQRAIDLLTTNETHFFREPRHFDWLKGIAAAHEGERPLRVWSAAASSGQEPYTIAMVLADVLRDRPWEVLGTDISTRVLERARSALYDMSTVREIPDAYLKAFCLKGVGTMTGSFLIAPQITRRVQFGQLNLIEPLPDMAPFDVVFLRNVMIYFREETKRQVVSSMLSRVRPGGWLVVGHSETLSGLVSGVRTVGPSIYQKLTT